MRRWLCVLGLICLLGLTAGCAGRINGMMRSWEGSHYSELLMRWGPPQAVYDDGNGGRILVYTYARQWTSSPWWKWVQPARPSLTGRGRLSG
jgi:hypothetical protein